MQGSGLAEQVMLKSHLSLMDGSFDFQWLQFHHCIPQKSQAVMTMHRCNLSNAFHVSLWELKWSSRNKQIML